MARRSKKNLTIEEELAGLKEEITKWLTDRKKGLKQIIEQKQTEALYQAVLQSGKSIEEVLAWINSDSQNGEGQ